MDTGYHNKAIEYDITLNEGEPFVMTVQFLDESVVEDVSGSQWFGQIRADFDRDSTVLAEISGTVITPTLSGFVDFEIDVQTVNALADKVKPCGARSPNTREKLLGYYDIEGKLQSDPFMERKFEGKVKYSTSISRGNS